MMPNNTRSFEQCEYEKMYNTICNASSDEERENMRQQLITRLLTRKDQVVLEKKKDPFLWFNPKYWASLILNKLLYRSTKHLLQDIHGIH
jgi:hypothetical protein